MVFGFAPVFLLHCNKIHVELCTSVLFCMHPLSPPPSEKVDLPQAEKLGAFFCLVGLPALTHDNNLKTVCQTHLQCTPE